MEFRWDFLDSLDPDVSSKILMGLDDPADIVRASSVSRLWRDFGKHLDDFIPNIGSGRVVVTQYVDCMPCFFDVSSIYLEVLWCFCFFVKFLAF